MTRDEFKDALKAIEAANRSLTTLKAFMIQPISQLSEQNDDPTVAKLSYVSDEMLTLAFNSVRSLYHALRVNYESDEHEIYPGVGA